MSEEFKNMYGEYDEENSSDQKVQKTSKYNQLSDDEKWDFFKSFHHGYSDYGLSSEDLKKIKLEKKGYDILENFILSNGGKESYPPHCYFTGLDQSDCLIRDSRVYTEFSKDTSIPWGGCFDSKFRNGTIYKSKNIILTCFNNLSQITKVRVDVKLRKPKKSVFDFSPSETVSLLPFHGFGHKLERIWLKKSDNGVRYGLDYKPVDFWKFIENKEYYNYNFDGNEISFLKNLYQILDKYVNETYYELVELPKLEKEKEKKSVQSKIKKVILENFDKNNNGELDILEGDNLVIDLLEKNESIIVEFDHKIIQDIVKLNQFLIMKKENLIKIFEFLKKIETKNEMDNILETFKLSIDNYQSLLIHSINMITSVKEKKLSTYYEIRTCFDKLNVFNSNWENEVSKKLTQIDSKMSQMIDLLKELTSTVRSLEITTQESFDKLSYITKSSFKNLQNSVTKELSSVRDGIELNNLITGINTYQLYTLNKNTKSLRS
tara:strand:+ start:96 stop:1568 length:1473 start_codon:yes stop_codon:yes gene_type:complete